LFSFNSFLPSNFSIHFSISLFPASTLLTFPLLQQLFLHFRGPVTLLIQSRSGGALTDVLTTRDVNEIADAPAGAVPSALTIGHGEARLSDPTVIKVSETKMSFASVGGDGKVKFDSKE
jgi:hypothetical protein